MRTMNLPGLAGKIQLKTTDGHGFTRIGWEKTNVFSAAGDTLVDEWLAGS